MAKVSYAPKKRVRTSRAVSSNQGKYTVLRMKFRGAKIKVSEARKAFRALHIQNS